MKGINCTLMSINSSTTNWNWASEYWLL